MNGSDAQPASKVVQRHLSDMQNASPNAYTLAIAGKQPFIMLNTGLLELLSPKELQVVIAHEVSLLFLRLCGSVERCICEQTSCGCEAMSDSRIVCDAARALEV